MDSAGKRVTDSVQRLLRTWLSLNNALILSSSAIVTGILAHFIHRYHERGTHVIYQEVIVSIPSSPSSLAHSLCSIRRRSTRFLDHMGVAEKNADDDQQAVLTLFLYLFAMFAPALKGYRGYLMPLNLALSYLWLTNLIFSSQDYSGGRCHYHSPPHRGHCRLKHAVQAFNILGL